MVDSLKQGPIISNDDLEGNVKVVVPEVLSPSKMFMPLYLISKWKEALTTCSLLTVAIGLPSRNGTGDFMVRIAEDGAC